MIEYPLHIPRLAYKGHDAHKLELAQEKNDVIDRLEAKINELMRKQPEPVQHYEYETIAVMAGLPPVVFHKYHITIDEGAEGFDAARAGLSAQQAKYL